MPTEITPEKLFAMLYVIVTVKPAMKLISSIEAKVAALFKSKKAKSELKFDE